MGRTISVQLYTIREALVADAGQALGRLGAMGFDTVEGFGLPDLTDRYAEALPASGLAMPTCHVPLVGRNLEPVFEAATRLGVRTVIDPWVDPGRWTTREDIEAIAAEFSAIAARAADAGLRAGYHNHWFELESRIAGRPALEVLAEALDPAVLLEVDTYWAEVAGEPAPGLLRRLGERVAFIHVKDGPRTKDTSLQTPVGSGELPIADILAAAPQALPVIELDEYPAGDVFDAIAESRRFVLDALASEDGRQPSSGSSPQMASRNG